jgi:ketosteroid isomerase-like protein
LQQAAPAAGIPFWTAIRAFVPESESVLADDDADAAVECLYEFLHAVARRDIDAAMSRVADDYHSFEDDCEIDYAWLRRRVEGLLDTLEGYELDASLSMAPEPLFHPNGILIYAEIQIDARHQQSGARRTVVDRKLAVFERQSGGAWKIGALSPVHSATTQ